MSLLAIGTMAFDAIETPFGTAPHIVGGAATYLSLAASYFTRNIHVVSVVGEDFPADFLADMNQRGIDTSGVEIRKGEKSFFWKGRYHNDLNTRDTLVTDLNVLATFDPKVPANCLEPTYLALGNLTPDIQYSVIKQLRKRPKLILMDTMNFWMDTAREGVLRNLKEIDVLTINDEEARQLSGEYSLAKAAKAILGMGPKYLVIKKGEHGALLFHDRDVFFAPALPLDEVFDPTGAGDSFAGGFMGYLAKTGDLGFNNMKNAIIYGSAMASHTVEKFGTERLASLSREDIVNRLRSFHQLIHIDIFLEN